MKGITIRRQLRFVSELCTLRGLGLRALVMVLASQLVMFAAPSLAQAATYGTTGTASIKFDGFFPGDSADCAVVAYYVAVVGSPTTVKYKVTCSNGWNGNVAKEGGTSTLRFVGGGSCSYSDAFTWGSGSKRSGTAAQGGMGPIVGGCPAQEVCLDYHKSNTLFDYDYDAECVGIDLGPLPQDDKVVGACQYGKAAKPTIGPYEWPGGSEYNTFGRKITTPLTDNPSGSWAVIAVNKGGAEKPYYSVDLTGETLGQELSMERLNQFNAPGPGINHDRLADYYGPQTTRLKMGDLVGVQLAWVGSGLGLRDWEKLPQTGVAGAALGVTDPTRCLYYYGERIADVAASDVDEPAAPLVLDGASTPGGSTTDPDPADPEPAPVTGGPCDFSFTNPASWASAGICALVDLFRLALDVLGNIARGIAGVVPGIVAGIGDLLADLFMPHPASWDWQGLQADLEGRPPFSLLVGVFDIAKGLGEGFQGAGSCGNLIDFGSGGPVVSCDQIRNSPAMGGLYGVVQAGLIGVTVIGTGTMVARSVGSKS